MGEWIPAVRRWVPRRVRYALQRVVPMTGIKLRHARRSNPLADVSSSDVNSFDSPVAAGIVRNAMQYHQHYVRACLEMGVPFRVLDLSGPDWIDRLEDSKCGVFLLWPDAHLPSWNAMIKDRVHVMEHDLGLPVFPTSTEIRLYEDKRRMTYWLQAHRMPHPETWIFYDLGSCERFVRSCPLPIVFKSSFGAAGTGVRIFRDRGRLRRWVRKVFRSGFVPGGYDRRERERGWVVLQEYLPGVREWRLVRIGDSFFGHVKGAAGGMHSGSGLVEWDVPEARHLDLLERVTEEGGFRSMDVDVFETPDGRLLINELQTVFGASHSVDQLRVDGRPGRFVRDGAGSWRFEPGDYARNHCANERVRYVLEEWLPARAAAVVESR